MAQTFGTFKSLVDQRDREAIARTRAAANADDDATPIADAANLPATNHQERVNAEMFKAIEILGRKIDRAFDDREHLTRRLALIESAATVDEKTGKLYLPVVSEGGLSAQPHLHTPPAAEVPRWMLATTVASTLIAVAALALVAMRPVPQQLTSEQLAILNALAETRMGTLTAPMTNTASDDSWQSVDSADSAIAQDSAAQQDTSATTETFAPPATLPEATGETVADAIAQSDTAITGTEQSVVDTGAMTPVPAEVTTAPARDSVAASAEEAPVSLSAEQPAAETAAPVTAEAPAAEAQTVAPAVAAQETTKPAATAKTPDSPKPLVAGLDIGRDANLPERLREVESRAMEGIPAAQHDLATIYAAGQQTTQDYKRAAYWFAQAAEAGIANAHYNLGVMFQQGLGLRKDAAKAMDWYKKAADLGHPEALYNLGIANIEGVGATRNVDAGIDYFKRASEAGVAQASFNLAVLYESGFAGPIDLASARTWYEKASTQGHAEAREALARLDKQLGGGNAALTPADMVEPAAGDAPPPPVKPAATAPAQKKSPISRNDVVAKVQRALIGRGLLPGSAATGKLDARTEDAIRAFQAANKLTVDGIPSKTLLDQINQTTR